MTAHLLDEVVVERRVQTGQLVFKPTRLVLGLGQVTVVECLGVAPDASKALEDAIEDVLLVEQGIELRCSVQPVTHPYPPVG
jgi:hypothetical protein